MDKQSVLASVLEPTDENIKKCAEEILKGGIVGMPTETVYGLAASAFNVSACEKIFQYKGRPLSDPLIVHVSSMEMAHTITQLDTETEELFTILSKHFWPGPLTIVLKANPDLIDKKLIAGGDSVGIRFPIHEIAQKFIKACGVPIAAPSANKFCHISPVNPYHVYEDFKEFPVMILNGGVCTFSMESTVIKITKEKIIMFRMGAVSPDDIKKVLYKIDKYKDFPIECLAKKIKVPSHVIKEMSSGKQDNSTTINQEAPGQFLKHYSPKLETFLYSGEDCVDYVKEINLNDKIVFIDYMGILYSKFGNKVSNKANYLELSQTGNSKEVMKNFYDFLHKAEAIPNMNTIVICDLDKYMEENEHKLTLLDRMWKAASFKKVKINI